MRNCIIEPQSPLPPAPPPFVGADALGGQPIPLRRGRRPRLPAPSPFVGADALGGPLRPPS